MRGKRPYIGVGIGIEVTNAFSVSPHAKSIPIATPTPIVQIFIWKSGHAH
jgi:hypothetical protein